jgi:lactate 2-monooxygenase
MTPMSSEPPVSLPGPRRQAEIYLRGVAGERPRIPVDPDRLEEAARRRMSSEAYAYVAGGAGAEATARANREAFERRRIVPRVLRDVSARTLAVELFGRMLPAPILLAPIGVLELVHRDADLAVALAAAAAGLPFIFSNQASVSMEECAQAMGPAPRWFQLYWSKNDALVESFVRRAEACGCDAIVVTLDTTMLGWRGRDLDLAYLPFLRGKGIAQYTSDPVFRAMLADPPPAPAASVTRRMNLHSIGALLQLRRKASLPGVLAAVGGRIPVLLDGGIRGGADVFKALALGARAVCVGRPYVYALALAGEAGVRELLANLVAELDLTIGLSGMRSVGELRPDALT